jgi:uncharacterized protein YbcI
MSKGQIEDAISKETSRFYATLVGIGPQETRTYILEDMVIVRLKTKLLPIEQKLLENQSGVALVKDIRKALHENTIKSMSELIYQKTGLKVISSHSDVSTKSGEILQVYILEKVFIS